VYIYIYTRMSNIWFDWLGLPMHKTWTSAPEPEGTKCIWDDLEKLVKCRFIQWAIYMQLTMYVIYPPVFCEVKKFIYYPLNYLLRTLKEHLGTVAKSSKQGFKTRRVITKSQGRLEPLGLRSTVNSLASLPGHPWNHHGSLGRFPKSWVRQ